MPCIEVPTDMRKIFTKCLGAEHFEFLFPYSGGSVFESKYGDRLSQAKSWDSLLEKAITDLSACFSIHSSNQFTFYATSRM
jgi:hypothetical protein